jgi:uncharacterized pyridoxamine 5'-phosphate oxidase family protein
MIAELINNKVTDLVGNFPTIIATYGGGRPNIAVATDVDILEGKIIIAHNEMRRTVENIKQNANICLLVLNDDRVGVRIFGTAEYFQSGKYYDFVIRKFRNETTTPLGAIAVAIDKVLEIK